MKHVGMSQSATPATRNEATRRLKPAKVSPCAELVIGTAIRASRGRLRTVVHGCEGLGTVERTHPQPPDPQSETGTLATHSGIRKSLICHMRLKDLATYFDYALILFSPFFFNYPFGNLWVRKIGYL